MANLLVYVPVFRLAAETVDAALSLEWFGGRIDRQFAEDLDTPPGPPNHLAQYQRAWELAAGYDALLTIESDIVPPRDAAIRLWRCLEGGADAAIGLYLFRDSEQVNACRLVHHGEIGPGLSIAEVRAAWGRVIEVSGVGFGCAMFTPRALGIPLRLRHQGEYCDSPWFIDAIAAGLRVVCDLGVVCGHVWQGTTIYPTYHGAPVQMEPSEPELRATNPVRVRVMVSLASPYGSPVAGDEIDIPLSAAVSWQEAGYAEIIAPITRRPIRRGGDVRNAG